MVKVDRVEIIEMPDPQQQVNALIAGEIDLIEQPPHDLIPVLKKDKSVQLVDWNPLGHQFVIRFNHLVKPFNNPKIRLAALLLRCARRTISRRPSASPNTTRSARPPSSAARPTPSTRRTACWSSRTSRSPRRCSKEAGYDGTPIVLMQSTTLPVLTNIAPVTKQLLEQGGFKVDMQSMDWQTLVTRRTKKDPADQGGWNVFHTFSVAADILNPISDLLHGGQRRQGVVRLADRSGDGEAARRLRQGDRPGQGQGARRGGAGLARSRPRSTAGSASGTDRAPRAPTSPAG